ncbi:MAG: hypothetical protein ABW275_02970 [Hansschlegelia sp.]
MRFLTIVGVAVALSFATVYSLATFVTPRTREMTVIVPAAKLRPPAPEAASAKPAPAAGAEASAADASVTTR